MDKTRHPEEKWGRDALEWDELAEAGENILIEQAKLGRPISYTDLNVALERQTGLRPFNFERADERAAIGYLLYLIVERNRPTTGFMLSAMTIYVDENTPGSGFYAFARDLGLLHGGDDKVEFWVKQVNGLHEFYSQTVGSVPAP